MNPDLNRLHPYPFEKLHALKTNLTAPADKAHIALSIGEPQHAAPAFVLDALRKNLHTLSKYPLTKGKDELRESICQWLNMRFNLREGLLDTNRHIIPVSGTREALFSFAQAVIDRSQKNPLVLMPNPFYQIYEGAALLAGAEPVYLNTTAQTNYLPDFDSISAKTWKRCQLLYICSPGNPTGAVMSEESMQQLIHLAHQHNFIIASDECYSELYPDENNPPPGLLSAARNMGVDDFKQCVVFHSLSKRSNLPGLRSGFVAGDADVIAKYLHFRTYHGCALPLPVQDASIAAWNDEEHVKENRELYREKFSEVLDILTPVLDVKMPDAGFYLWPNVGTDDAEFAAKLFATQNVTVLPGTFLSRESNKINPGRNHVRMALVASVDECIDAAHRIRNLIETLK